MDCSNRVNQATKGTVQGPQEELSRNELPEELIFNIFSYLNAAGLAKCFRVSKEWKRIASDNGLWKVICRKEIDLFLEEEWETHYGKVQTVTICYKDLFKELQGPDPIDPTKKLAETHKVLLMPSKVREQSLTMKSLNILASTPLKGNAAKYRYNVFDDYDQHHQDETFDKSYIVRIRKEVVFRNEIVSLQMKHVEELNKKNNLNYRFPTDLEVAAFNFTDHVKSGKRPYGDTPWTYSRTLTNVQFNGSHYHVIVGGFDSSGLNVYGNFYLDDEYIGVGLLR
jgi:hypothetical protein